MKIKKILAFCTALLMLCALTACGGTTEPSDSSPASTTMSHKQAETDSPAETETTPAETETESGKKTETAKSEKSDKNQKTETTKTEKSDTAKTTKTTASGGTEVTEAPASASISATTAATIPVAETTQAPTAGEEEPETQPTKYIYLEDTTAKYAGEGIYVEGSIVKIAAGGTYEISGTLSNGQIYILTDSKKVKLHLNNVSITNHAGAAINCQNAKKLVIKTLPGTTNYLEDGGTHDADKGTIFSEDTVQLSGEGVLNIKANYAHGIQSDDDIVVNGGTLNITSTKSCLHSNDGIEINGGVLFCDGGTNGIKTDGYVTVTGGQSVFLGGTREEKGAVYCDGSFTVTGGSFWAIGNTCTAPDASTTSANVIGLMFTQQQPGGTLVNVMNGGNEIFTMTSPRGFKYVVYTGPNLLTNAEYAVSVGGSAGDAEHYVYTGTGYNGGTDCGTFTAGNTVTYYTVTP